MKRVLYYVMFSLLVFSGVMNAQNQDNFIHGQVTDSDNNPIDGVAVVLQTLDSVYVDAIVTDSLGEFKLNQAADRTYRLLFQHILFEPYFLEVSQAGVGVIRLTSRNYELDGVIVKAERPQVKVENGALKYDVPQLMKDKTVSNAFEVVKQIPGIIGGSDEIQLLGAGSPQIILNGQLTTMSVDQLTTLLKSIPSSRVKNVEVMYNAPAKYNIKGSVINVILDKGETDRTALQGEVGADYLQRHYASGKAHANLLYSTPNLTVDFLVSGDKGRMFEGEEIMARHTLENGVTEVNQFGRGNNRITSGDMRLGLDYSFKNEDKLSAAYSLGGNNVKKNRSAETVFSVPESTTSEDQRTSLTTGEDKATLHNVRVQYDGHTGITAGMDFTNYHSPSYQYFLENQESETLTDMQNNSKQDISQWALFANHTHTFATGWTLNYGVHGGYTSSKTYIDYLYDRGNGYVQDSELLEDNLQKEYTGNAFMEVSKQFGEHFSANVSLKGEYFKSDYTSNGVKSTLWDEWALFPNASLSYMFSPLHILQLNVNSDKTYPSYWNLTPQATPINSYSEVVGNPALKPYRTYEGQLLYIFKQKYTFMVFAQYEPDYFAQLPYQSSTELKNVFRFENMDYSLTAGIGAVIPFRIGSFMSSQFTAQGIRLREKMKHFNEISFDNSKYLGQFFLNNTFTLSESRPNLKLDLNGYYITGAVQGLYDLGSVYNVTAGLKWQFADDRATLLLKCDNIFRSNIPNKIEINQANQYSRLHKLDDTRCLTVSFIWKFGGYKSKSHDKVDTSRFGK